MFTSTRPCRGKQRFTPPEHTQPCVDSPSLHLIRKKGTKILQQLKKQARGLLKQKEESLHSGWPGLALSLTREVSGEEEESESRDMEEAEGELDGSCSNTATFCSGGQGTASTQHTVETKPSETASKNVKLAIITVTSCLSHPLVLTVGLLLTLSAAEVIYLQRRQFDVRAAAVSVAFRKEKEPRSPPDRVCQDFTQTGCLARPVTGEVRRLVITVTVSPSLTTHGNILPSSKPFFHSTKAT